MPLWPAKKDPDYDPLDAERPEASTPAAAGDANALVELTARMGQLRHALDGISEQLVDYLIHRESQAIGGSQGRGASQPAGAEKIDAISGAVLPLCQRLDRLEESVQRQLGELADGLRQIQERLDTGSLPIQQVVPCATPQQAASPPTSAGDWQRVILGPELAEHPGLDFQRQQLIDGLFEGDPAACGLIGLLLVFRSATAEKMPPLLKEIGEALYRWQPKTSPGSSPLEESLVAWLERTMQESGIPNTLELVHPGQRFDAARHTAATRGVEISEVCGWVVLRDNGKVYTKASVAVR